MTESKPKRKPSGYNIFIKKCMNEHSEEMKGKPFGAAAPIMKSCTVEWKNADDAFKNSFKSRAERCEIIDDTWKCPDE